MDNYYGRLKVPGVNITLEQLILVLYPTFLIPAVYLWLQHLKTRRRQAIEPHGCVKLGLQGSSNLADQYEDIYESGTKDQSQWKVKAIHMHPIKSCAPVELDEAEVDNSGVIWDRKFTFAELLPQKPARGVSESPQTHEWTFRTLRTPGFEKLALVRPEVWIPKVPPSDPKQLRRVDETGALIVKYPNVPMGAFAALDNLFINLGLLPHELSFQVPLVPPSDRTYPRERLKIIRDESMCYNMAAHIPDSFKTYMNAKHPLTLFRIDPDMSHHRKVYGNAPTPQELGYQSTHAGTDDYPLQLLNLASVRDLAKKVNTSIPRFNILRFRSNFILTGMPPYEEDTWKKIKISRTVDGGTQEEKSHIYYVPARTLRCKLPNVDPDTSARHPTEPDKTLRSFRCIDDGDINKACMGMFMVPADLKEVGGKVKIRVGDTVTVVESGKHFFIHPSKNPQAESGT